MLQRNILTPGTKIVPGLRSCCLWRRSIALVMIALAIQAAISVSPKNAFANYFQFLALERNFKVRL